MNQDIGRTGYILIVNNDPAMREAVSSYFSDHKFPAKCLSNWSEVKCTGNHPSLIIMDQPLGLNDGLDRLRSIRSKSDIPVIITSHRADDVDPIVNLELGADDYIVRQSQGIACTYPRYIKTRAGAACRGKPRGGWRRLSVQWLAAGASSPKAGRPQ